MTLYLCFVSDILLGKIKEHKDYDICNILCVMHS